MFAWLAIVLFVLFVVHCSIHWSRVGRMINKFPGPPVWPVLGNAMDLVRTPKEMFAYDRKMSKLYKKGYRFWTVYSPAIKMIDPEDIEALLSSTNPKHMKKNFIYDFLRPWLNDGLLISVGEKWHTRRKLLTPTFHFNILKQFCGIFRDETEKLVRQISKVEGETIDIQPLMFKYALQTICETAMGAKLDEVSDEQCSDYMNSVSAMSESTIVRFAKFWMFFDFLFNKSALGKLQVQLLNKLHKFTDDVVKKRRSSPGNTNDTFTDDENVMGSKKRLAMLDLLLDAEKKGLIDDEGIREEVDTFMFEGHDTTMMGLTFLLMEIANNPDVQDKIAAEISEIFSSSSEPISMESLNKMTYLEKCIKEALRLYPSVHMFARVLQQDLELKNATVPSGTMCFVHVFDTHRNEDIYANPDKFDPERFSRENCAKRHPYAYIPFSAGPRNCIGQKFAMLEMKAVAVGLVRNFQLEAVTRPKDIVFKTELILKCLNRIEIKFFKRERPL